MQFDLRVQFFVAVLALPVSVLAAYAASDSASEPSRERRKLFIHRRPGGPVGGDIHRTGQGADASALSELSSRRRPSASG